ncbi:BadF/BadG/BcrA/BcrD ATPase family protein [Marinomonas profundimaris]|uniref:N-acetylglucosamine kinase n=1 Tax=Marinomonas profundimaris TaxID=1208321 RepID=W1RPK8_9GAMM|nr:BadF/BadG/BcrA/BcrD ATPase family protein [Marinomonas profundimaris]ETI58806.1 N-acetylglucosamine kinase [Marinomonas profundimaris]
MTGLFIGVDGGGTFCRARLVDGEGNTLGEAVAGSGNPRIGIDAAWQNIMNACLEACHQGNIDAKDYAKITLGLGLAGANQPLEQDLVMSQSSLFGRRYLLTDAHSACLGAFDGQDGALLILGTGSCGVFYQQEQFHIVGGWGFPLSDQGSGARIGLSALEYSLAALDGISPASPMTDSINAEFSLSPEQYVLFQNRQPLPKEFGAFAIQVFEFAQQKDPVALKIVAEQVHWVSQYLDCLIAKGAEKIVLVGGVSEVIRPYLPERFCRYLCEPKGDAMAGAILMAKQQIGRMAI